MTLEHFPHLDERVLHRPNSCILCDRYPDWQGLRHVWRVAYTDYPEWGKIPCPSQDPLRHPGPDEANAPVPPRG
jgi:hypothetical protein